MLKSVLRDSSKSSTKKKRVSHEELDAATDAVVAIALRDAGAIPPASDFYDDDDENGASGSVQRDVDVLSDVPEIDTTRAEEAPTWCKRQRKIVLCVLFIGTPILVLASVCASVLIAIFPHCSPVEIVSTALFALNNTHLPPPLRCAS